MNRLFRIFNKEFSRISEAALVLSFFTLGSQLLALVRDRLLAGQVGPSDILDMYYAAFRVPDLVFTLGAALVSVSILMPFLSKELAKGKEQGKQLLDEIFTSFCFLMITLSILLFMLMPWLNQLLFPGFSNEALTQVTRLSRIMLLSPFFLGVSNLFATITQTAKRFFVYALAPVFYNIGIIVGIIWFYPMWGVVGFAWGVVLGAFLHMLIQLPVVLNQGLLPRLTQRIRWNEIKTMMYHSLPRTLTLSLSKIIFLVFVSFASGLTTGGISIFNLSYNLQSVPLALIGVSYSVAAFPTLVEYYTKQNYEAFFRQVMIPIRQIIFWSLPVISLFVVLRAQIVRVILGTGGFDWTDTRLTAASLALFIISIAAQSIVLLLVRAYYASGKTWKPFYIALISGGVSIISAYILIHQFLHVDSFRVSMEQILRIPGLEGTEIIMLPLAFSLGMFANLGMLIQSFLRDFPVRESYQVGRSAWESLCASLLIGITAYIGLQLFDPFFSQDRVLDVFAHGFTAGVLAIVIGGGYLVLIHNQELRLLFGAIYRRLRRAETIVSDATDQVS